jgi:hypothetical protein
MTNLGYLNFYLGIEFLSVNKGIFMRQKNNMQKFLSIKHEGLQPCPNVITKWLQT